MSAACRDRESEDWVVEEPCREFSALLSSDWVPPRASPSWPGSTAALADRRDTACATCSTGSLSNCRRFSRRCERFCGPTSASTLREAQLLRTTVSEFVSSEQRSSRTHLLPCTLIRAARSSARLCVAAGVLACEVGDWKVGMRIRCWLAVVIRVVASLTTVARVLHRHSLLMKWGTL